MEPGIRVEPACSKWDIRQKVWDHIENNNLADFPRPVHHRIPNFKVSRQACQKITDLEIFRRTREVKVDPDKPLEGVRLAALQAHKTLLVPTPRLRTGLFNKITPPSGANKEVLRICSTSQITREMMAKIPILRNLQDRERKAGRDVSLKDENASEKGTRQSPFGVTEKEVRPCGSVLSEHKHPADLQLHTKLETCNLYDGVTVYIGNIPSSTRVSELKSMLRERGAAPLRLTWQGAQHRAFLDYKDVVQAKQAVSSLEGISINGISLLVELARTQRHKTNGNQGFGKKIVRETKSSNVLQPHILT
ncbi:hypothetical protein XENTR_v10011601 [Xenopus tropicalis]|uniref:Methenyltetrahydrofolate synthetase domain-containing n=1 Tax=Xenopus tropicalis TaxID=8364 RepID=A0A803K5F8_XENTR|nr:hypothetical protein XENTR_v10011601 [Xenopus tropicalis]